MKKTIIITTAVAVFAVAPAVSVFAACDPLEDDITVTITDTCTFTRSTGNGTYSASMQVGKLNASVGTSTFNIICNNANGYTVTATPTSITGTGEAINYSATTPTAGSGTWTAYNNTAEANIAATSGVLMSSNTVSPAAGASATVVYKVSTRDNQAKGAYSGSITYAASTNS